MNSQLITSAIIATNTNKHAALSMFSRRRLHQHDGRVGLVTRVRECGSVGPERCFIFVGEEGGGGGGGEGRG